MSEVRGVQVDTYGQEPGQITWMSRNGEPVEQYDHLHESYEACVPACPGWPKIEGYKQVTESVNHPQHYGGDTTYEAIKVIEAWGLGFCLGNTVKYISRAGKKDKARTVEDLKKARWYLDREIKKLEES